MSGILDPALVALWRDAQSVQLGLDPASAVVVTGLDRPEAALLRSDRPAPSAAGELARRLAEAGVPTRSAQETSPAWVDEQLIPDLASAVLVHGSRAAGRAVLARRATAHVRVQGAGRVGAAVATLLAAAGVGRISVDDDSPVRPVDVVPGGPSRADVGRPRTHATEDALAGHRPQQPQPTADDTLDLVVTAPVSGAGRAEAARLTRLGLVHLPVRVEGTTAVVGPLVVPGRTACLHCTDLHRSDRDPAWPHLVMQAETSEPEQPACDVTLAVLAASQAAQQVLAQLAGATPATVGATLETTLPYGLTRRRSWSPHPGCGCRWQEPEN